jgi:hypothetical protein
MCRTILFSSMIQRVIPEPNAMKIPLRVNMMIEPQVMVVVEVVEAVMAVITIRTVN